MIVRTWGCRGSIPVSGPQYVRYGGDTTCVEIRTKNDRVVIVDAGTGIRRLGNALLAEDRREVVMLFTHAHWDHILGFPFFKPIYRPDTSITLYGCPVQQGNMEHLLANTMTAPHYPVPFNQLMADIDYQRECGLEDTFSIDSLTVSTIPLSHPNMGLGFRFEEDGKSFVFLTDNELSHRHRGGRKFDDYAAFAEGADLLLHDSEYTPQDYERTKGWGHSLYTEALRLAVECGARRYGLFHHNQDRGDEGMDGILADSRRLAAEAGADLEVIGANQEFEIEL